MMVFLWIDRENHVKVRHHDLKPPL